MSEPPAALQQLTVTQIRRLLTMHGISTGRSLADCWAHVEKQGVEKESAVLLSADVLLALLVDQGKKPLTPAVQDALGISLPYDTDAEQPTETILSVPIDLQARASLVTLSHSRRLTLLQSMRRSQRLHEKMRSIGMTLCADDAVNLQMFVYYAIGELEDTEGGDSARGKAAGQR